MIKSWFEYIKENVDPNDFNGIVYLRGSDNSSEQFWFYIHSKSPDYLECLRRNSIDLIQLASFYISPELEVGIPNSPGSFYVGYSDTTYINNINNIQNLFDHPISVYGMVYEVGSRDVLLEQIKKLQDKNKNLGDKHFIFKIVQIQLIEFVGKDDFDVIDYYL